MRKLVNVLLLAVLLSMIIGIISSVRLLDADYRSAQAQIQQARVARAWASAEEAPARQRLLTTAYAAAIVILLAGAGVIVIGGSAALVVLAWRRRGMIYPQAETGLYPQVLDGRAGWRDLNEPRAQTLAALAASSGRRPSAAVVGRVLSTGPADMTPALPEPVATPLLEAANLPAKTEIYNARLPQAPALMVGIDERSRPVELPLRNLGNVLIGGLPGHGKSESVAAMIAGLMRQDRTGTRIVFAVCDTKMVDFGHIPQDLRGLRWPVAIDMQDAHLLIEELLAEVRSRYQRLHDSGARNPEQYVQLTGQSMPYLVAFIDELADMTADIDRQQARAFNMMAMEIGRKGRAAGVSLVMATQRPSVDVVPSSLRNICGAQIAYRVSKIHDSQAILGEGGAELLPAGQPGRCLVKHGETRLAQAYMAGIENGRFDQFLQALPRGAAAAWPVPEAGTAPVYRPEPAEIAPNAAGIPVFDPTARSSEYTPEQRQHILDLYQQLGSLKAVQRRLYDQEGGYWFYRIRAVVEEQ